MIAAWSICSPRRAWVVSRASVQRILRAAGRPSPRRRRPPRHRSRRSRMPQAGMLVQLDGSRHDWLEDRGPDSRSSARSTTRA
jgi:hypothetical protein